MKNDELLNNEEQNENIDNNVNEEAAEKEAAENVNADKEAEEPADKESDEQSTDDKAADAEEGDDQQPLDKALEKIAELQDKYLRSVAEFDNYRKRTLKEKTELILNGSEKAVSAILPVVDDIERAIANKPKILICDEPTGNLDPGMSREIIHLLGKINKEEGTTVLMVSHDMNVVNQYRKRTIVLENGHIVADLIEGGYHSHE